MNAAAYVSGKIVAVVGSTGFIGRHVVEELQAQGASVVAVPAPRLVSHTSDLAALERAVSPTVVARLRAAFEESSLVVNAAGVAVATSGGRADTALHGVNALLPLSIAQACREVGARFVHISSAAVQGRLRLDESMSHQPLTAYARSKAAGERLLSRCVDADVRILRPTSVHGPGRAVSQAVARFARSPFSTVPSGPGRHTPQVHVRGVARAVVQLLDGEWPLVCLQPSEGFDTRGFLTVMGAGHEPRTIPAVACRLGWSALRTLPGSKATAHTRRLELLWWGQEQAPSTLDGHLKPVPRTEWQQLATEMAKAS